MIEQRCGSGTPEFTTEPNRNELGTQIVGKLWSGSTPEVRFARMLVTQATSETPPSPGAGYTRATIMTIAMAQKKMSAGRTRTSAAASLPEL